MEAINHVLLVTFLACLATISLKAAHFYPATATNLIESIRTANANNEDDIIDLGGQLFTLTDFDNRDNNQGFNGLPSILADKSHKIILKNGIIERDPNSVGFRLIRVAPDATLILKRLTLRNGLAADDTGNFPSNGGGAILNIGHLSIKACQISFNAASSSTKFGDLGGGAIYNFGGTIELIGGTTFFNNSSSHNFGGAIINGFNFSGDAPAVIVRIEQCTFLYNTASIAGGAIANFGTINSISDSTFSSNEAGTGGAIFNGFSIGIDTIINSTFARNYAIGTIHVDADGGAISNLDSTIGELLNNTIANNGALRRGGGIANVRSTLQDFESNIVAQNAASYAQDFSNDDGTINRAAFNVIATDAGHPIANGVDNNQVGTVLHPLWALLGPLQNNGGPTATMALLPRSPAIDSGSNPENLQFDQRGPPFKRIVGNSTDVGAFEAP